VAAEAGLPHGAGRTCKKAAVWSLLRENAGRPDGPARLTFNEAEAYAFGTKSATKEQIAVKAHARKRSSGSVEEVVPEGTPVGVVEHRLSEEELTCAVCGTVIGKESHRSLKTAPARF